MENYRTYPLAKLNIHQFNSANGYFCIMYLRERNLKTFLKIALEEIKMSQGKPDKIYRSIFKNKRTNSEDKKVFFDGQITS